MIIKKIEDSEDGINVISEKQYWTYKSKEIEYFK